MRVLLLTVVAIACLGCTHSGQSASPDERFASAEDVDRLCRNPASIEGRQITFPARFKEIRGEQIDGYVVAFIVKNEKVSPGSASGDHYLELWMDREQERPAMNYGDKVIIKALAKNQRNSLSILKSVKKDS